MRQKNLLRSLARELSSHDVMRRGLDAERILPRLKVLPFIHAWELVLGHVQFEAKAKPSIQYSNRHPSIAIRSHIVLPNLFVEVVLGAGQVPVTDLLRSVSVALMGGPDDICDRGNIFSARIQQRITEVNVITEHMRRRVETTISYDIVKLDCVGTNLYFDSTP